VVSAAGVGDREGLGESGEVHMIDWHKQVLFNNGNHKQLSSSQKKDKQI
jgi:hypothetical protein